MQTQYSILKLQSEGVNHIGAMKTGQMALVENVQHSET
jgi:hypothetical protein